MILRFLEGIQTLAKIHCLDADYDISKDGNSVHIKFIDPVNARCKDCIVLHLDDYTDVEEAITNVAHIILNYERSNNNEQISN